MPLPTTFTKVFAGLQRIAPPMPSFQSALSLLGSELHACGVALATANDLVESFFDEMFPNTADALLDRWEKVTRVPSRPNDTDGVRQARVLSVLRRTNGPRLAQLAGALSPLLLIDATDFIFVEPLRSMIEEGLTQTTGIVSLAVPTTAPGLSITLGKPWPGVVDDTGVSVYLALSSIGATTATLTSPDGTVWAIPVTATSGWYSTRSVFTGVPAANHAGGSWTLSVVDTSGPTLTEARLLVSNSVDSAQIYNFFVLRDPTLSGTADLAEAQRLFTRTAMGHMRAFVVENLAFTVGDQHSLCGRDPIGA